MVSKQSFQSGAVLILVLLTLGHLAGTFPEFREAITSVIERVGIAVGIVVIVVIIFFIFWIREIFDGPKVA